MRARPVGDRENTYVRTYGYLREDEAARGELGHVSGAGGRSWGQGYVFVIFIIIDDAWTGRRQIWRVRRATRRGAGELCGSGAE